MANVEIAGSLADALERLARAPDARPIAGGVGVMLRRALGDPVTGTWIAIGSLPALRELRTETDAWTVIGAATAIEVVADAGPDLPLPPLLVAAARCVANRGIRTVGTIGGNVVAGGGRSDLVAALVALDATGEVVGRDGGRIVQVERLVAGEPPGPGEIVRAFRVPSGPAGGWGWERLSVRGAADRSVASVAVAHVSNRWRIAITCASSRVIRSPSVEANLDAGDPTSLRDAARVDLEAVSLDSDDRASERYRRHVLPVLIERAARAAFGLETGSTAPPSVDHEKRE